MKLRRPQTGTLAGLPLASAESWSLQRERLWSEIMLQMLSRQLAEWKGNSHAILVSR